MWWNPQFPAHLVTFTEEIFNGKFHFLCSDWLRSIFFSSGDSHIKGLLNSLNLDQIHHIRNNWLGLIFFSPGDSHTKRLCVLLHLFLECVTEVDTDTKGKCVSSKVTLSNDRVLCLYVLLGDRTREQLTRGRFLEGLQNYMENKNKENENKIMLGDFNCTMYKMEKDGRNKTQTL